MPYLFAVLLLLSVPSWAENTTMKPIFYSPNVDMVYPDVAGDYLVYSQRVSRNYQVMRLSKSDMHGAAKDVSATAKQVVIRFGVALANGNVGYISNRLGYLTPWLALPFSQEAFANGIFQGDMLPNHLQATADGTSWVFDDTFEATRRARISGQHIDGRLHSELLGQAWRMYHEKYWAFRSGYPETQTGVLNKFQQPHVFTFAQGSASFRMLSDGFDADISNDGQKIVFVREIDGNFDLWLQNIDGSGLKRLTTSPYADVEPSFNADGSQVVFVSNRDSGGDVQQTFIRTLDLTTGEQQTITSGVNVVDGGPAWLDEATIVFHSNRNPQSPQGEALEHWSLWTVKLAK